MDHYLLEYLDTANLRDYNDNAEFDGTYDDLELSCYDYPSDHEFAERTINDQDIQRICQQEGKLINPSDHELAED